MDSRVNPRCLSIRLKRSKCDQFGTGIWVHVGCTFWPLCPVSAMLSYLAVCPSSLGPLFIFKDGTSLSRERLVAALSQALALVGIDSAGFTGHSFHIEAATSAAGAGMPDSLIQTLGRWKSAAFLSYIRTPREVLSVASVALAGQ